MSFILASSSPRRKELLATIWPEEFAVISPAIDENKITAVSFDELPQQIALAKLHKIEATHPDDIVLAADTMVYHNGVFLGKPHSRSEAIAMLESLQNNVHLVITGYAIADRGNIYSGKSFSTVRIPAMTVAAIAEYVDTGSSYDKAGGYGIQDPLVSAEVIEGSTTNVMGFPTEDIKALLLRLNLIRL